MSSHVSGKKHRRREKRKRRNNRRGGPGNDFKKRRRDRNSETRTAEAMQRQQQRNSRYRKWTYVKFPKKIRIAPRKFTTQKSPTHCFHYIFEFTSYQIGRNRQELGNTQYCLADNNMSEQSNTTLYYWLIGNIRKHKQHS